MVKFYEQFEYHKIPEWYDQYIEYATLKSMAHSFEDNVVQEKRPKIPDLFVLTKDQKLFKGFIHKDLRKKRSLLMSESKSKSVQ